ncbi:sugar kinase [Microvirga sp. W0021]|uniref:Sugar kinase n=1 Tax=Hohaiivirga grylli TaxID=3133970 RepID=A0ABV0BJA4_9HYPH
MAQLDILAFGEPLMELAETKRGEDNLYLPGFGGDVSNCAIAAARLGAKTGVFSHLGEDKFGSDFLELWDKEGVDRSTVVVRPGTRTGIYFISYGPEGHIFTYLRKGSAASLVGPADLPLKAIENTKILHVSGISQAISGSCADAGFAAIHHARRNGVTVSYDTNLRLRLWDLDRARAVINAAVGLADIALPGMDDAQQLTGLDKPEDICQFYLKNGSSIVALTMGKSGTMIATKSEVQVIPAHPVNAIDATGAGDVFDGAFLTEWVKDHNPFRAAAFANEAAALSTLGQGAVAPMPTRAQVEAFMAQK